VLASVFAGADHIDHVITQLPYGLVCAGLAALMYCVYGFFVVSPWILVLAGGALLIVFFLSIPQKEGRPNL
jgi:Na+/H+ antiporter NhaC